MELKEIEDKIKLGDDQLASLALFSWSRSSLLLIGLIIDIDLAWTSIFAFLVPGRAGLRDNWQLVFSALWLKLVLLAKTVIIGSWPFHASSPWSLGVGLLTKLKWQLAAGLSVFFAWSLEICLIA
jgi:hypothetical protein